MDVASKQSAEFPGSVHETPGGGVVVSKLDDIINWARSNSLWPLTFATSCCGIEMMAFASSRFDSARFGSEKMGFTPRQSDLLIVAGTVTNKMSWVVRKIYDQMPDPKWVISMGVCASTGGMYRSYAVLQGVDNIVPVDIYIAGCPPRPEALLDALIKLQGKVSREPFVREWKTDAAPSKYGRLGIELGEKGEVLKKG